MKFPKIQQFRHVIKLLKSEEKTPVIKAVGTTKIHGSNGGIRLENGNVVAMSRNRNLTIENDNNKFAAFVAAREQEFKTLLLNYGPSTSLIIFGEWCGRGINKGCAVHKLDRMFVIFAVAKLENDIYNWLPLMPEFSNEEHQIYHITKFGIYEIEIDFAKPQIAQGQLVDITMKIEQECPVGKAFGVAGIGEGVVWRLEGAEYNNSDFWFKVKGKKHSVTKTKNLAPTNIEKVNSIKEFVDVTVTPARLEQGLAVLLESGFEIIPESTGKFLQWVANDILLEEEDKLISSNLVKGDVTKSISAKAKEFWFNEIGL